MNESTALLDIAGGTDNYALAVGAGPRAIFEAGERPIGKHRSNLD